MERFAAAAFLWITRSLAEVSEEVRTSEDLDKEAKQHKATDWHGLIDVIGKECQRIGLSTSHECAEDIKNDLDQGVLGEKFRSSLSELENTIRREMQGKKFFYMPPASAEFYDKKELFGTEVNAKFSAIQYDMVEAGNCYAMGRGTACVFHLMRVMEVGVQQLGSKLGVALVTEKNWQNILDEVNKAIKVLPPKASGTVEMSQASANLYSVKLAWRNEVMHPNDTYTLEEAENLIRQVKIFMRNLADIL
jgi:hypothetical protein